MKNKKVLSFCFFFFSFFLLFFQNYFLCNVLFCNSNLLKAESAESNDRQNTDGFFKENHSIKKSFYGMEKKENHFPFKLIRDERDEERSFNESIGKKRKTRRDFIGSHQKIHILTQPEKSFARYSLYRLTNEFSLSLNSFDLQSEALASEEGELEDPKNSKAVQKIHLGALKAASIYKFSYSFLVLYALFKNHNFGLEFYYDYERSDLNSMIRDDNRSDLDINTFNRYLEFEYLYSGEQYEASQLNFSLAYRAYSKISDTFFIHYGFSSYLLGLLKSKKSNHLIYSLLNEAPPSKPDLKLHLGFFIPIGGNQLFWFLSQVGVFFDQQHNYSLTENIEDRKGNPLHQDYGFYDFFRNQWNYNFKIGSEFKFGRIHSRIYFKYLLLSPVVFIHARTSAAQEGVGDLKLEYSHFTRLKFQRKMLQTFLVGLDFSFYSSNPFLFDSLKLKYQLPWTTEMDMHVFIDSLSENYQISRLTAQHKGQYAVSLLFVF